MQFGNVSIWAALLCLAASMGCYLTAQARRANVDYSARLTRAGRAAFMLSAAFTLAAAATLGTLLVTHRFDVRYVYEHSARGMAPLYWFPSFWAGQEGSFLLWGVWTAVLGVVLAATARDAERRVMPIYSSVLLFLVGMLALRSPFLPNAMSPMPTEGQGLNPNLENPWMVIHPPTLLLGFAALAVPFAFALSALVYKDWNGWLRRALPWGLFGFSVLGLAMMMGGYWAYEMLGWGGFWGWDPVENGPFVPWLGLVAFLHAAQIERVRGGFGKWTLLFGLLPFVGALYETFLTRTGVLDAFSVHSFSTLGGVANDILLGVLLVAVFVSLGALVWRARALKSDLNTLEAPASREFALTAALVILTVCALIAGLGMSAPLLTGLGQKLHLTTHVSSVKEDFYNRAMFPVAILLALGLGLGPHLARKGRGGPDSVRLSRFYALAVVAAIGFIAATRLLGTTLPGRMLAPQLLLFTASAFAMFANLAMLRRLLPVRPGAKHGGAGRTVGGALSHLGVAVFLLGVVCLVTFVRKDDGVDFPQGTAKPVLGGTYTMTYLGQTSDYKTDKNNALRFAVASKDGREKFEAHLPFAERTMPGSRPMVFGHPSITHHAGGDLYLALKDGPVKYVRQPVFKPKIALGQTQQVGPFQVTLEKFERDARAAAMAMRGEMPDVFAVGAVLHVTDAAGKTTTVTPQFIVKKSSPDQPESPEIALPGGWVAAFQGMSAGSADAANPNAGATGEGATLMVRPASPAIEGFQLDVSTRPMISLVWIGTLLLVAGGFVSMRRRLVENQANPVPDLPLTEPKPTRRAAAKGRARTTGKPGKATPRHAPTATAQK